MKGVRLYSAVAAYGYVPLNLAKRADAGPIPDAATIQVDRANNVNVFSESHVDCCWRLR